MDKLSANLRNAHFFKDLSREATKELKDKEVRAGSIANTRQNIPLNEIAFNQSSLPYRKGHQVFLPTEQNISRPINWDWNGRNLFILNTLAMNAKRDYPDAITFPRMLIGRV